MKKNLTLKILLVLIFSDVLETFTHFCFKKSAIAQSSLQITSLNETFAFILSITHSPFLWLGILSATLIFIAWSTVLSKIDLSVAVPVASFSYIFVPLVSMIFLKEQVNLLRWVGIISILIGVILVSKSSKNQEGIIL